MTTTEVAITRSKKRAAALIGLGVVTLLALLVRLPSIAEPLGVDQNFWASSARALARGQMLYVDVWDHKPPGIVLAYYAAFSLFGWMPASIVWADIAAAAATTLLLFLVARRLDGNLTAALSAMLYATLTMPSWLYRHGGIGERAVAETFIVVLVAAAAWCATRLTKPAVPSVFAVLIGICMGAVLVLKPNAGLYFPALLAWMVLYSEKRDRRLFRISGIAALASLIVPAFTLAWLWSRGALPEAWVALVAFNRMYVSQGLTPGGYALDLSKALWLHMKTDPLWLAGSVGAVVSLWELLRVRRVDAVCGLAIAWGAASALVIIANGARLFSTYFIQPLAPLALMAGWLFASATRRTLVGRLGASVAAVLMVVLLVQRHYPTKVYTYARMDAARLLGRLDDMSYLREFGGYANDRGYSALANEELAAFVRARTTPDDLVYLFGINGAGVYFAADRRPANRFLRVNFYVLGDFQDPRFRLASVTRDLAASRPVYLIFERLHSPPVLSELTETLPRQPEVVRLLESYRFETQIEDFALYRRFDRR